jgi:hypothetical protein
MFTHTVSKKMMLLVFAFFYLVNVIASGGHIDTWDGIESFLTTESMALKNTAKVDPTIPSVESLYFNVNYTVAYYKYTVEKRPFDQNIPLEPVYTVRSLLISAVALPFYELALVISASPYVLVSMLTNSLLIALTSMVIFCFSLDLYRSAKIGFALALMFNVCSFVLPYATTLWAQPLQALTLVAALFFIYKSLHHNPFFICNYLETPKMSKRGTIFRAPKKATAVQGTKGGQITKIDTGDHHVSHNHSRIHSRGFYYAGIGGLLLGLSVFAHATSLVILPGFLVYAFVEMRRKNRRSFLFLFAVLLAVLLFVGVVNYVRFNSFTEFGYGHLISLAAHNGWTGLVGLLVSPGAGLFLYFPLSILLPWAAKSMVDQNMKRLLYLFVFLIVINWLNLGTLSFKEPTSWWGLGWGPRYFLVLLPFITLMVGSLLVGIGKKAFLRYSMIALSAAGFCITMLGVLFWFYYDQDYLFYKGGVEFGNIWIELAWNPIHSPIVLHVKALHENYAASIPVKHHFHTSWHWVNYGLAPCQIDNYMYCTYGIGVVAALLALVVAVMGIILWRLNVLKRRNRIAPVIRRGLA